MDEKNKNEKRIHFANINILIKIVYRGRSKTKPCGFREKSNYKSIDYSVIFRLEFPGDGRGRISSSGRSDPEITVTRRARIIFDLPNNFQTSTGQV